MQISQWAADTFIVSCSLALLAFATPMLYMFTKEIKELF